MVNLKKKKNNFKSLKCGKPGHFKKDCRVQIPLILKEMSLALLMMVTLCVVKQRLQMKAARDLQICNDHEFKFIRIRSVMVKMHDEAWTYVETRNEDSCGKEANSRPHKGFFTFLGIAYGTPTAHKAVVGRDVVFIKDKIQENEEGDSTTRETTSIQMEKEFQSNDSFEVAQHKVDETNESQALITHTLNRERKRPRWHSDYVMESNVAYCLLTEE
uniref:Gag-Pol polyprotein n=1 Tax=Tanacetum cinerariifolium TaxID=118510 RepID=A0A6L2NWA0_TANCI|nr:Gag-Pol polyprotein [Tanacetum cinerariifolium]